MFKGSFYVYTRTSTEEQGKKGFSHQYQIDTIKKQMATYETTFLGVFSDTMTGTKLERPNLRTLYEICKSNPGLCNYIIVQKMDRLGRNTEKCLMWVRMFKEIGVEVNSPFEYIDFSTSDWAIMLSLRFAMAQTESIKISERTRDGINQANRLGYWTGSSPFGYTRRETSVKNSAGKFRKVMYPDENAPILKEIFERFISGEPRNEIYKDYDLPKTKFYTLFQKTLLYAGYFHTKDHRNFKGELIKGKHEPIISLAQHEAIQDILSKKKSNTQGKSWATMTAGDEIFYLKGHLKCNKNNCSMTACFSKGRSKRYAYYQSTKGPKKQRIRMEQAHAIVQNALNELSYQLTTDIIDYTLDMIEEVLAPKIQQKQNIENMINRSRTRLKTIEKDYMDGFLPVQDFTRLKAGLNAEIATYSKDLAVLDEILVGRHIINRTLLEKVQNVGATFSKSNSSDKRDILRVIFPSGFSIDEKEGKCRTAEINELFGIIPSKSSSYKHIEIENGITMSSNPTLGGRQDKDRTISDILLFKKFAS